MNDNYEDIIEAAGGKEPKWYDYYGVPRYCWPPTVPEKLLGRIRCQQCAKIFLVSLAVPVYIHPYAAKGAWLGFVRPSGAFRAASEKEKSANGWAYCMENQYELATNKWSYGDPPFHDCIGDTMGSIAEYDWPAFFDDAILRDVD